MSIWSYTNMWSSIFIRFTLSSTCSYPCDVSSVSTTINRLTRETRKCTRKPVLRTNYCILACIIVSSNFQIICKLITIEIIKTDMRIVYTSIDNSNRNTFTTYVVIIPDIIDSHSRYSCCHMGLSFPYII